MCDSSDFNGIENDGGRLVPFKDLKERNAAYKVSAVNMFLMGFSANEVLQLKFVYFHKNV